MMLAACVAGLLQLSLTGCHDDSQMSGHVIVQNDTFTLTGDSIVEGASTRAVAVSPGRINAIVDVARLDSLYRHVDSAHVRFVEGKRWQLHQPRPVTMPEYSSGQPLVDALYNMSIDHIADGIDGSGRFIVSQGNWSRMYCSIYLSLAALKPHQSMATLRSMVDPDSIIMQRQGQWPVVSDHIGWATAAWEVYKITGDLEWLRYSHHVVEKTMAINRSVLLDHSTGLIHGAGYTPARPLGAPRMTWMGYNDLFACMSLGNNILTTHALAILDEMCEQLGIESSYQKEAQRMKDAINQHLWNEDRGCYSSFLYGTAFPRQSPLTDNTSQAMCVLWGIADDQRAENLISHTPIGDCGVNVTYPPANPIEPYFVNSSWATTQALWNLAAADVGNENALRRGLGALYRAQALYQSRGIHMRGVETDLLGTSASDVAMILRVLLGMNFEPEGIEFSPLVPVGMDGTKHFKGFNYRRAVLDFTVNGTGREIATIMLDGKALESPFLPGDIQGRHQVVINMGPGGDDGQGVTIYKSDIFMPPTPVINWIDGVGHIVDPLPGMTYALLINGQREQTLTDTVFELPEMEGLTEFAVEIVGKYTSGFMSKPLTRFGLTPQVVFYPSAVADTAEVTVNVARGGDYLLDVGYKPTGTLDVRRVSANGYPMGTLVMASGAATDPTGQAYSNMVQVKLLKGENVIRFDQIKLPKSFTPCQPVHVRVISF